MERRHFLTALIGLSLVPASERAQNPKLVQLEQKFRDHFGSDAAKIMEIARTACTSVVDEYPDRVADNDADLDFMTDLAMDRALGQLQAAGLWSSDPTEGLEVA